MYKQYLEVREGGKWGKGVFTSVIIPANTPIIEITGPILLDREAPPDKINDYLQIGPNTFLASSGGIDDYLTHSCNPNCKMHVVGNRAFLYSIYVIPPNGELNFDYATTSTDTLDTWQMNCICGYNKCRQTISGYQYIDNPIIDTYKSRGMLPLYILEPNLLQKR